MNQVYAKYQRTITFWTIWTVFLVLALTACQGMPKHIAYKGPQKDKNEIATFIFPAEIKILFINKEKYSSPLLGEGAMIELLPGSHQFLILYQDIWDLTGEEHERVKSKPISVKVDVSAGEEYRIKFKKPGNVIESRSFAKNPSIDVYNTSTNKSISANIEYNIFTESFFSKILGLTKPESEHQVESDKSADTSSTSIISSANTKKIDKNRDALEMLKYWWEAASEDQKNAFKDWVSR